MGPLIQLNEYCVVSIVSIVPGLSEDPRNSKLSGEVVFSVPKSVGQLTGIRHVSILKTSLFNIISILLPGRLQGLSEIIRPNVPAFELVVAIRTVIICNTVEREAWKVK
jgi:hypothetical protein